MKVISLYPTPVHTVISFLSIPKIWRVKNNPSVATMIRMLLFAFVVFKSLNAFCQIPQTLSYQGLLTDSNGVPLADGNSTIIFRFYNELSGGTAVTTRGPITATTFKGLFNVIIGNGQGSNNQPLPFSLGDSQYYVGISANGQQELSPRVPLTAVPYAFTANTVKTVDASTITSGTVPNERLNVHLQDLADGQLSGNKVGPGINANNITTGTIQPSLLPTLNSSVPIGTIVAFAGTTVPNDWLVCNGSQISRTTYSNLFNVIGVVWGGGNGTTTFNLPDLRGRFLRGLDGNAGNDPDANNRFALFPGPGTSAGNNVGSYQNDEIKSHTHTSENFSARGYPNGSGDRTTNNYLMHPNKGTEYQLQILGSGGNETRPKNANVNYIIKVN